jgi:phage shock protein A
LTGISLACILPALPLVLADSTASTDAGAGTVGILPRLAALLQEDITEILDRAEDPEKLIDQLVQVMADSLRQAREQVRSAGEEELVLEANLQRARAVERQWEAKAELAAAKGRDDLAREALRRKVNSGTTAQSNEKQLRAQRHAVAHLHDDLQMLGDTYEALLGFRDILFAQYKAAKTQAHVGDVAKSMSPIDTFGQLARLRGQDPGQGSAGSGAGRGGQARA